MAIGEHLRILVGGRFDHAIDCGDRTVLHLSMVAGRPEVRRALVTDFTRGAERVEVLRPTVRTYPPKMVVRRAFSKLGDSAVGTMFPTPEHFSIWCLTGQAPFRPPGAGAGKRAAGGTGAVRARPARAQAVSAGAGKRARTGGEKATGKPSAPPKGGRLKKPAKRKVRKVAKPAKPIAVSAKGKSKARLAPGRKAVAARKGRGAGLKRKSSPAVKARAKRRR